MKRLILLMLLPAMVFSQVIDTTMVATVEFEGGFRLSGQYQGPCYIEFTLEDSANYVMNFNTYGEYFEGFPILSITQANGVELTRVEADSVWTSSSVEFTGDTVRFSFLNDKYESGVGDRNLLLKEIYILKNSGHTETDTLYLDEIAKWDGTIFKCIDDSVNVTVKDTVDIGDTLTFKFIQPMWESPKEQQPDPVVYPFEKIVHDFVINFGTVSYTQKDDSLNVEYVFGKTNKDTLAWYSISQETLFLLPGIYAVSFACGDTAGNVSKWSSWKLFVVKSPSIKWLPFIPIFIEVETKSVKANTRR